MHDNNHRQRRLLRAGNGHATAAPLRTLMKSRCLIASPRLSRRDIVAGQICTLEVGRREEVHGGQRRRWVISVRGRPATGPAMSASLRKRPSGDKPRCVVKGQERTFEKKTATCQVQKSRATISRAACPWNPPPTARRQGGTGQSSIRSRSERRNRYCESWQSAPAHWTRSALGRSCRCSTEAR